MKKIVPVFLSIIIASPAFANIHINPDTVVSAIKKHVPADKVNSVMREYNAQLKASNGAGIGANKLWNVCAAAGWNIKEPAGKTKCRTFVNELIKTASIKVFEVCGSGKGKSGGTEYCIDDFFTNKVYGGTQVGINEGIQLSKEYARIKHNDDSLQCSDTPTTRLGGLDRGLKCASKNKNAYYEFVFDDLYESVDQTHHDDVQKAVCKLHDATAIVAGCRNGDGTEQSAHQTTCWDAYCIADSAKCARINKSMSGFGYSARYENNKCTIDFNSVHDASELKTAFGIDNFVFCNGIQVQNDMSMAQYVKKYIAQKANISVDQVKCDAGFRTYTGKGCTDKKNDIKTCYAKGKQIDLVFDDINESWNHVVKSGKSGMSCIINTGGRFDGKHCRGLTKKECDDANKVIPGGTDWDKGAAACVLKDARSAQRIDNGITIATGVVITVGTLGVGAAVGAGASATTAVIAVVGSVAIDAAFIGLERLQEINPHHRALQFMRDAKNCNNATCAANIVKEHIARLGEVLQDLNNDELDVVSDEMDRIAVLQTDDQFIAAMNNSTLKVEDYALKASSAVLIAATLFIAPEQAVKRVWARAGQFSRKMEAFIRSRKLVAESTRILHIYTPLKDLKKIVGRKVENLSELLKQFGKTPTYSSAMIHGDDAYPIYRIVIENTDDYAEMLSRLQHNGWRVYPDIEYGKRVFFIVDEAAPAMTASRSDWLLGKRILPESTTNVSATPRQGGTIDNFTEVRNSFNHQDGIGVFKFETSGKTYYLKATNNPQEAARAKQAYNILGDSDGMVSTVHVVSEDQSMLAGIAKQHGIEAPNGYHWYLTEAVPGTESARMLLFSGEEGFQKVLGGKKLTIAEQDEILGAVDKLNRNGLGHGDIENNLMIVREPNGKLRVSLIDYDPKWYNTNHFGDDRTQVLRMLDKFQMNGWAEERYLAH